MSFGSFNNSNAEIQSKSYNETSQSDLHPNLGQVSLTTTEKLNMEKSSIFLAKKENKNLFSVLSHLLQCQYGLGSEVAFYEPTEWALNPNYFSTKFPRRQVDSLFVDVTGAKQVTTDRLIQNLCGQAKSFKKIFVFHDLGLAVPPDLKWVSNIHLLAFPFELEQLTQHFVASETLDNRHWPLECDVLSKFDYAPCDFYLKLSDSKWVRAIKKGSPSCGSQVDYYSTKGINQFWIPGEDLGDFSRAYIRFLFSPLVPQYEHRTNLDEYPINRENIESFSEWVGACPAARATTEKNYKIAIGALRSSSHLQNFYQELKSGKSSHRLTQSYLIALLSTSMSLDSSLEPNPKALQALAFAALLSSLGFNEEEYQYRLNCLLAANLAGEGVNLFLAKQVDVSSNAAEQWDLCPPEVSKILENGKAALGDVTTGELMDDLSVAFIVAQEFVSAVLGMPGLDWAQQLRLRATAYPNGRVKEAMNNLLSQLDLRAVSMDEPMKHAA